MTKLAPQCIVSTSLPRGRQANRRGREAPARLTCQPGPWAGRRPLHWRIAAGAEAAGGAQRSPAMMAGAKRIATSIARPVPARAGNTSSGTGTALAGPRSSRREEARAPSLGTSASAPLPEGWHQAVAAGAAPSGTAAHSPGGATYKNSVGGTNGKSTPGPGALNLITMGPRRPRPPRPTLDTKQWQRGRHRQGLRHRRRGPHGRQQAVAARVPPGGGKGDSWPPGTTPSREPPAAAGMASSGGGGGGSTGGCGPNQTRRGRTRSGPWVRRALLVQRGGGLCRPGPLRRHAAPRHGWRRHRCRNWTARRAASSITWRGTMGGSPESRAG